MTTLKFSKYNSKLNKMAVELGLAKSAVLSLDLPAGYTCPMANLCLTYANKINGKITDGKEQIFRCYAASSESAFTNTRKLRWHNFDLLRKLDTKSMVELILNSIPKNAKIIRIHSSGDFFNESYFNAWVEVATLRQDITFFGYTKVLPYVKAFKPANFKLIYSFGGKLDAQLDDSTPVCRVVSYSPKSACIESSSDDYIKIMRGESFTLNLHGTQPAKAKACA
mgnify:CR=1 FL=1